MKLVMTPESLNHQGHIETGTEVGKIYLHLFRSPAGCIPDHPPGRPWHLVGMGTFHESPEAALAFLTTPRPGDGWEHSGVSYHGYGANSHAPCGN